jgi:hypothetical protein
MIGRPASFNRPFAYLRKNPQMWLSILLFSAGMGATVMKISTLAGALFGSGATMLGGWINELNTRRSTSEDKARREKDARDYLAPELRRMIERAIWIHERSCPNFIGASVENTGKPPGYELTTGDVKEDFLPFIPRLYPDATQFRDLPGEQASALVAFYDSLEATRSIVEQWWEREGQLPVNIFLGIMDSAKKSLKLALLCIEQFDLDKRFPPEYAAGKTLTERITMTLTFAEGALKHHIERSQAKQKAEAARPLKR